MSKFGVGVGDDFPVDDGGRGNQQGGGQGRPQDDREEYEEWKRRRDEYRARREEWRRQRDEWRARRRAFKEKVRQAARESFDPRWDDDHPRYGGYRRGHYPFFIWPTLGLLIPILILALVVSLIAAIFKSPFAFLVLIALGFAFFAWRHHHAPGHYGYGGSCRDYDFDLKPTNGGRQNRSPASNAQAEPPVQNGAIITPPPSSDEGKSTT